MHSIFVLVPDKTPGLFDKMIAIYSNLNFTVTSIVVCHVQTYYFIF